MVGKNCSLIGHFEGIEDPRVNRMKLHKLIDIIVIALCAMIAGCDTSGGTFSFKKGDSRVAPLVPLVQINLTIGSFYDPIKVGNWVIM